MKYSNQNVDTLLCLLLLLQHTNGTEARIGKMENIYWIVDTNEWIDSMMQTHLLHSASGGMSLRVGQHTERCDCLASHEAHAGGEH